MGPPDWAAITFSIVVAGVIAFQIALALGAPWGSYAMGGAVPGRFPASLRAAAVVQALLLSFTVVIVLSRAGLVLPALSEAARSLIWVVAAVALLALVLNAISRSAAERRIWVPGAAVMLGCSLLVAVGAGYLQGRTSRGAHGLGDGSRAWPPTPRGLNRQEEQGVAAAWHRLTE